MNYKLSELLSNLLQDGQLESAIQLAEQELRQLAASDFHKILGRNLFNSADQLADFVNNCYYELDGYLKSRTGIDTWKQIKYVEGEFKEVDVHFNWDEASKELKAMYAEMNGFSINYGRWFVDLFGFKSYFGTEDRDWLSDYDTSSESAFIITGFEDLQRVFEHYMKNKLYNNPTLSEACDVCEFLIVLRLQQLFVKACDIAKQKGYQWPQLPVLATAHDYDLLYNVTGVSPDTD